MANFRLHLWFAMKNKFAAARSTASLFLEALMLVFIFAYANGDFEASDEVYDHHREPLKGVVLSYTMALSAHSVSQPLDIVKHLVPAIKVSFSRIDLYGVCVALSKARYASHAERSTFYIASADNIP
jgi:hypothetical protein